MNTETNLNLWYATILVGRIRNAFTSENTWYGDFELTVDPGSGTLAARLVEFIDVSTTFYDSDPNAPDAPDPVAEFDRFSDLVYSGSWHVETPSGQKRSILGAPAFFDQIEISWFEVDAAHPVQLLEQHLHHPLPAPYRTFLLHNDERIRGDRLLLYPAEHILERNTTFEVQQYAPGYLAVGDNSGGSLVLIRLADPAAAPFLIDAGALGFPEMLHPLARSWVDWESNGFPLTCE